jgi:RHS repeat-associated protein
VTNYRYNTLNTVIAQTTPDAGRTSFWYDRLGRLALSQNAKQLAEGNNYSYTLYDSLSRITEVGQINDGVGAVTTNTTKVPANWTTWLANNATNRYQVTGTVYDLPAEGISPLLTQNASTLRNRVSYSTITPGQKGSDPVYGTYYNYDIEGNVSSLLQDYDSTGPMGASDQQYKRIDYGYDLVSGKVNSVSYQPGKPDAFLHFYRYDAENRLTDVYTTADSVTVEHEAHYEYYKHGPLARVLIGQNQVQGLDYAYTLQGWLKAVNGSTLDSVNDMGHDGDPALQSRKYIAKDAYAFSLHYYDGDYYPINGTAFLTDLKSKLGSNYRGLYNGNISSMAVNIGILNNPKLYNYHYDQLNRLTGMDVLNGTNTGINLWTNGLTDTADYRERASYDPNGNILTYTRNGYGGTQGMDNLTYHYNSNTNQLNHIGDAVASGNYPNDLDDQDADNYTYDAAGNLIQDKAAGITTDMTWSVYGKLLTIPSKSITYQYDAAGNRIGKTVGSTSTWYVRDAQGNILATYSGENMALQEQEMYGSSRLGMISNAGTLSNTAQYLDHLGSGTLFTFTRGKKLFELTNHLGNVLVTVSDKKFGTPTTGIPSQISYYTADVKSAQDYYPFGMEMPGRQYNATYPYSFNGKRDDKDAEYGWQDYGMREYDRRRAQFISVDPLTKTYPWYSPFQFAGNKPIIALDLDGKEEALFHWLFPPFRPKTPAAIISTDVAHKVQTFQDSRTGRFLNGAWTATTGIVGTIGSINYISESLGTGAALGGTVAMQFSLAQTGIGVTQMINAFAGPRNRALEQSNSLPGLIAYETNSKYAPFVDALSGFVPTITMSGNSKEFLNLSGLVKNGFGVVSASKNLLNTPSVRTAIEFLDQLNVVKDLVIESFHLYSDLSHPNSLQQKLEYSLSYTVKKGDNLNKISKLLGVPIEQLAKENGIRNKNEINEGQSLKIHNVIYGKINLDKNGN